MARLYAEAQASEGRSARANKSEEAKRRGSRFDGEGSLSENQEFIEALVKIRERMESPDDEQVRNFINYR